MVLVLDPLETGRGAFLDLLDSGGSHGLGLDEAFADLLLALGGGSALAAFHVQRVGRVVVVVPLVSPRRRLVTTRFFVSVIHLSIDRNFKFQPRLIACSPALEEDCNLEIERNKNILQDFRG